MEYNYDETYGVDIREYAKRIADRFRKDTGVDLTPREVIKFLIGKVEEELKMLRENIAKTVGKNDSETIAKLNFLISRENRKSEHLKRLKSYYKDI